MGETHFSQIDSTPTGPEAPAESAPETVLSSTEETPTSTETPAESGPDKFEGKSREEIIASYEALESRLGERATETPTEGESEGGEPEPLPSDANGLLSAMNTAFVQTGEVTPELRKQFTETTGLPEAFIDSHIELLQMKEQQGLRAVQDAVGGEKVWEEMNAWAAESLSDAERASFNQMAFSGDPNAATIAAQALLTKYHAAVGSDPALVVGKRGNRAGIKPFAGDAEWRAATKDPRYKQSSAYRKEVEQRLAASMQLGLIS